MLHSNKAMEKLHNGMQNLCANFLGHLVQNGLYEAIRYTLYTNSMQRVLERGQLVRMSDILFSTAKDFVIKRVLFFLELIYMTTKALG